LNSEFKREIVAVASYLAARDATESAVGARPVMPSDVVAFALGRPVHDREALYAGLTPHLGMRRLYREMFKSNRIGQSPLQACAHSGGTITSRQGEGFMLRFKTSRASAEQVYVTLEIRHELDLTEGETVDIHAIGERQVLSVRFPPVHDGKAQRLFEHSDPVLALLRDDRAELELIKP